MGWRICTANKFPGDADGAVPGTSALEARCTPAPRSQVRGPDTSPGQSRPGANPVLSRPAPSATSRALTSAPALTAEKLDAGPGHTGPLTKAPVRAGRGAAD